MEQNIQNMLQIIYRTWCGLLESTTVTIFRIPGTAPRTRYRKISVEREPGVVFRMAETLPLICGRHRHRFITQKYDPRRLK